MNESELQQWAHETCHDILKAADLKRICKARGFAPLKNAKKGDLADYVELRLLGAQGLTESLAAIEEDALWAIHALRCAGEPVEIGDLYSFFDFEPRVWLDAGDYKIRYDRIHESLVSKGLVLMRRMAEWERKGSRYAELRLCLPEVVAQHLPALPLNTEPFAGQPAFSDWTLPTMERIRTDLSQSRKQAARKKGVVPKATLEIGILRIGDRERPQIEQLRGLLERNWLGIGHKKSKPIPLFDEDEASRAYAERLDTIRFNTKRVKPRKYILSAVPESHAIAESCLLAAFERFGCALADAERRPFVEVGLRFGFIAAVEIGRERYLVPNKESAAAPRAPTFAGLQNAGMGVQIPLERVSLAELLLLARISMLEVTDRTLQAEPSLIHIGRVFEAVRESAAIDALLKKSPRYRKAFATVGKQAGRLVVHSGITVLKLGGPDVQAQMTNMFEHRMAPLGNGFFAVCRNDLPEMIRFAKKKGFSPKMVARKQVDSS